MLAVYSPYDRKLIKKIPVEGLDAVEKKLIIANSLYTNNSKWIPAYERISILNKTAEIMQLRLEELIKIAIKEGGKPYKDTKAEVIRAINSVKLAAEYIGQIKGEQIPMGLTKASTSRMALTIREPIGVVVSISAFNHPLNLIVHQTVTALAAGCPVIVKPALTTPLSCLNFVDILKEAGLPEGWCQAIICKDEIAEKLVTDKRVSFLSFIGSARVGWYLRLKLSSGTRCALEHGGVAPVIVEKDVEIDRILPSLLKGSYYHAGQVCVSVQRIFVHADIYETFTKKFAALANQLIVGDPLKKETDVGPLILPQEVNRVKTWVDEALMADTELLCGGKAISETCYEPTVLLNPSYSVKVSTQEIFGPVVCIYSYKSRNEAIKYANSLDYHFQAAVFTNNLSIAIDTIKKLNASAVMVNDHTAFRVDWMPFGGRNDSGIGTGGIPYTIDEMTQSKLIVFNS